MFDLSFLMTLVLIFLVTMVGGWLHTRRKDPCLSDFEDFHVTLEMKNNKIVWGTMQLAPTGLELIYRGAVQDEAHLESSYVLYAEEYAGIQAIYRYADMLSGERKKLRDRDIERSFHPGPLRFLARQLRNLIRTATEALNEALSLIIGRVRQPAGRYISDTSESYLKKLGSNIIGHVGGAYDPLLERFIGRKVVIEIVEDGQVHEHVGIFKNYSADFLEILDVFFPNKETMSIGVEGVAQVSDIEATLQAGLLTIENRSTQPVLVESLHAGEEVQMLNVVVDTGEKVVVHPEQSVNTARVHLRVVRELDMLVPRAHCSIRHRAENFQQEGLQDLIFDLGVALADEDERILIREQRLRDRLRDYPKDALAAANLGGLLIQRQAYEEAMTWLKLALSMQSSLPDNGRRARMQLRELRRRLAQMKSPAASLNGAANGVGGDVETLQYNVSTITDGLEPEEEGVKEVTVQQEV